MSDGNELQPDSELPPPPSWPEGTILVMVDGVLRPANEEELADIEERQQPKPPVKRPTISKLAFLQLLVGVFGEEAGLALLQPTTRFGLIFLAASQVDYVDLFVGIDGDPEQPGYVAQLLAQQVVTQQQADALESAWPTL